MIEFDARCRGRLVEVLTGAIGRLQVKNCLFLTVESLSELDTLDSIPPRGMDELDAWIGEKPLSTFVWERISSILDSSETYDAGREAPESLTEFGQFADAAAAAERLIGELESLPWKYRCMFPMPFPADSLPAGEIQLSDDIWLRRGSEDWLDTFPLSEEAEDLGIWKALLFDTRGRTPPSAWNPQRTYLDITVLGFVGSSETSSSRLCFHLIRAIAGLLLAVDLVERQRRTLARVTESAVVIYRDAGGRFERMPFQWFSAEESAVLAELKQEDLEPKDFLGRMMQVIVALKGQEFQGRIVNAARWYFASHTGSNELLSFLQATTAIEILLGDEEQPDNLSQTELLSNRCAYLISSSGNGRKRVIEQFRKIYRTRSRIVHVGKNYLSEEERRQLYLVRYLCQRVLTKEILLRLPDIGDA